MATKNQIDMMRAKEEARANQKRESQGDRDLRRKEDEHYEKRRSNLRREEIESNKALLGILGGAGKIAAHAALGSNDPIWHGGDSNQLKNAASFSFGDPLGSRRADDTLLGRTTYIGGKQIVFPDDQRNEGFPGICTIQIIPSIGYAQQYRAQLDDAIIQGLDAYVRHANSGSTNYDPVDLAMTVMAGGEIYSRFAEALRIYGVARLYENSNWYFGKNLLFTLRCNAEDIRANLANFRSGLEVIANRLNLVAVPTIFPIINRHIALYSGIYQETLEYKSPIYAYIPHGWHTWAVSTDEDPGDTGVSMLRYEPISGNRTVADICTQLNDMIDAYLSNQDVGTMNGDIIKAFGNSLWKAQAPDENYIVKPTVDEYMLESFRNCTTHIPLKTNSVVSGGYRSFSVGQVSGQLEYYPKFANAMSSRAYLLSGYNNNTNYNFANLTRFTKPFLTLKKDTSPEMVMEATRLMLGEPFDAVGGTIDANVENAYMVSSIGSEIPVNCILWQIAEDGSLNGAQIDSNMFVYTSGGDGAQAGNVAQLAATWSTFNYAPSIKLITANLHAPDDVVDDYYFTNVYVGQLVDPENYRLMQWWDIDKLTLCSLQNLWGLPKMAVNRQKER